MVVIDATEKKALTTLSQSAAALSGVLQPDLSMSVGAGGKVTSTMVRRGEVELVRLFRHRLLVMSPLAAEAQPC